MHGREENASPLTTSLIQTTDENGSNIYTKEAIVEEFRKQLWLAGPLISVSLLQFCLQLISVMFVGHLGELALSGASMATSFASVTGFSLMMGMASALDTLCGQSYGAKEYHMLGIHMQRAMFVLLLTCVPLAITWANTAPILKALGQNPLISQEAGIYARFMIPSAFGYAILQCQVRFLQTQNIVFPMMISSGITTLLHLLSCWILVLKSRFGSRGAAVANSISYWLNALLLSLYIKFSSSCKKTWTGFSREALHDVLSFVRLAVPSAVMVCLESWSFQMMVLLSGLLTNPELETSVLSICLNTSTTVWMIPFGLSCAVRYHCRGQIEGPEIESQHTRGHVEEDDDKCIVIFFFIIFLPKCGTRVSNELGAGHPRAARLAVGVVLAMAITEGIIVGFVMILVRNIWGHAYSNEIEVIRYAATMMPILAVSHFMDGLQCVLSGTVRGCGWQKIGAFVNLGSYYLVGIPVSVLLAFVLHLGGKGLWSGILCALFVQVVCLFGITLHTNWDHEAKKARERVHSSIIPVEILS